MSAVTQLAKPNMRGMHIQQVKKILIGATLVRNLNNALSGCEIEIINMNGED